MSDHFDRTVATYMTRLLETATPDTSIAALAARMHARNVSGIPILDGERLVGVVTRIDLIRRGALHPRRWSGPAMSLPDARAAEVMTREPHTVEISDTLRTAGAEMSRLAVHRLFVMEGVRLAGVLSTLDLAAAVADARVATPLSEVMTSPIVMLDVRAPLGTAIGLLSDLAIGAVVVADEGRPVGVFTQLDALTSRDLPRTTPLEAAFDAGVICLADDTHLFRAAAHAAELDVRRVIACRNREAVGIVSGLDFARAAATDRRVARSPA